MSFGARLKEQRMKAGLSLQELADAIGVSKAHIYDLESGRSSNPTAELLMKLSNKLKKSVGYWLGEEEEEGAEVGVMYRQLQALDPETRELIQAIIDKRRDLDKEKQKQQGAANEDRPDGAS
jgi:transcriptional regulator with XRE-family HTH domain